MTLRLSIECPDRPGLPVLFVHGFAHHRCVWSQVTRRLDSSIRPIAFDLRGHGDSAWSPERRYAIEDHAGDIGRVLDEVDVERAVVVGHSLGGLASTLFAAANPERVAALALIDTGPHLSIAGVTQIARDSSQAPICFEDEAAYEAWLASTMPFASPESLKPLVERALVERSDGLFEPRLDPGILEPAIEGNDLENTAPTIEAALRAITCPTLLVRGGLSSLLSREVAHSVVDEFLADGHLVTLERAGHAVMLDDPIGLQRELRGFIEAVREKLDLRAANPRPKARAHRAAV